MSNDIQWDHPASLMRVVRFATADDQEELVARGTVHELVGNVLEMSPEEHDGLLIRAAGSDWTREWDADAIRELAARPEYTGAAGRYDTSKDPDDLTYDIDTNPPAPLASPTGGTMQPQNTNNDPSAG